MPVLSSQPEATTESASPTPSPWLSHPVAQELVATELAGIAPMICDRFGFVAMQVGMPEVDWLASNRMPQRWRLGPSATADVVAEPEALPLPDQSVDLLVLPHTLDFSSNPHQVLREATRVLAPEGHVLIIGFNPMSLWGLQRLWCDHPAWPWQAEFLQLGRIKDWLLLLDLECVNGRFCAYRPFLNSPVWRERLRGMEPAGDRWWPLAGAVYMVLAKKRVPGMTIIRPQWKKTRAQAVAEGRVYRQPESPTRNPVPSNPDYP